MELATPPISRLHFLLLGLLLASLSVHYHTVLRRVSSSPPDMLLCPTSRPTEGDPTDFHRSRLPLDPLASVLRSILSSCLASFYSVFDRTVRSRAHPDPSGLSRVSLRDGWSGPKVRCYSHAGTANFDMGPVEGLVVLVEVDSGRMVRVSDRGEGWYIESTHMEYGLAMAAMPPLKKSGSGSRAPRTGRKEAGLADRNGARVRARRPGRDLGHRRKHVRSITGIEVGEA
ncbi:hypothetical protein COCNU_10G001370 [Cocos nucifera]|uniref:Uncharacterized protein n=1 Tax=Cocos nucifera TaxID=13894 RepID=A0A8K0IL97_COCNU|nr:hypothetical protein COCNU_10G001370 [Cocos nucifera]